MWRGARAPATLALAFASALTLACDRDPVPTPTPSPSPSEDERVNGTERLGWDQQVSAGTHVADYGFAAYVDGVRVPLEAVACVSPPGSAVPACDAPLPAMSAGRHTLRLVASRRVNGVVRESAKSEPLVLVKVNGRLPVESFESDRSRGSEVPLFRDRSRAGISVEAITDRVSAVADLAAAPDGRVFVAEREGRVRIVQDGVLAAEPALSQVQERRGETATVFSMALHPDFQGTRLVYLAYATESAAGTVLRVVRYREVAGRLGEAAVLLEETGVAGFSRVAMRFGPDRKLYVALAGPGDRATRSAYAGTILRMNDDGTTPVDNPRASPVLSSGHRVPLGLAWPRDGGAILELDMSVRGVLHVVTPALEPPEARRPVAYAWEAGALPSSLVTYAGAAFAEWRGDLLVGMLDGGIQRLRIARGAVPRATSIGPRLARAYGAVGALAVAADGTVYVGTANRDAAATELPQVSSGSPGSEFVLRLRPSGEPGSR